MTFEPRTNGSVTDAVGPAQTNGTRNAVLRAELHAMVEDVFLERGFTPEVRERLRGEKLYQWLARELTQDALIRFQLRVALWCYGCGVRTRRHFDEGDVVFRRWRLHPETLHEPRRRHLGWYFEECVHSWHPSWWRRRVEPVPCAAGCGVLVTHPYQQRTITTCSPRCAAVAAAARRAAHRTGRACADCGQPFQPGRADAVFCSDACRQRAYRKRKAAP